MILKSKIFQSIFLALYTGGLYFNSGNGDYTNNITWSTMSGYFFFLSIACVMGSLSPVALVFPSEREVFLKEENSRLYGVVAYFLSRNFIEIPYLIFLPLIFILIIYWMVGQASTAEQFFIFYLICFVTNFSGSSLGLFIGSILRD
jgi:ATP-binding cassette subfamily G (WHITE) protein 2